MRGGLSRRDGTPMVCEKRAVIRVVLDEVMSRAAKMLSIWKVASAKKWAGSFYTVDAVQDLNQHRAGNENADGWFGVKGGVCSLPHLVCGHCAQTWQSKAVHRYIFHPDASAMCSDRRLDIKLALALMPDRILVPVATRMEFRRAMVANVHTTSMSSTAFLGDDL